MRKSRRTRPISEEEKIVTGLEILALVYILVTGRIPVPPSYDELINSPKVIQGSIIDE